MEIQCPKCKATQITKGRIEFPCRKCGTMLKDPRVDTSQEFDNRYVRLSDVIRVAKENGAYSKMKSVLELDYKRIEDVD